MFLGDTIWRCVYFPWDCINLIKQVLSNDCITLFWMHGICWNQKERYGKPQKQVYSVRDKTSETGFSSYCAFQKHGNSEVQKTTDIYVFRCHQSPLRKQNFTTTGLKGHGLWFVISGFRSLLCVSVFQGSLLFIVITTGSSKKRNSEGRFWTSEFACLWKAQ